MEGRIEHDTVASRIYAGIRGDVLTGRLKPNQKLTLDQMAKEYQGSIGTLREVLNRLSSENLVIAQGQRGFSVAPISEKELRELSALRLLLECHALESSFTWGDIEWEGRVIASHHALAQIEERTANGDRSEAEYWNQCDRNFHETLISCCVSKTLISTHAGVFGRCLRYQMLTFGCFGDGYVVEHRALLESALSRDAGRAKKVLQTHILACIAQALTAAAVRQPRRDGGN